MPGLTNSTQRNRAMGLNIGAADPPPAPSKKSLCLWNPSLRNTFDNVSMAWEATFVVPAKAETPALLYRDRHGPAIRRAQRSARVEGNPCNAVRGPRRGGNPLQSPPRGDSQGKNPGEGE